MRLFNRLMVRHHNDIMGILETFSGDVVEMLVEYHEDHGMMVSKFDEEVQADAVWVLLRALGGIRGFMEGERRVERG